MASVRFNGRGEVARASVCLYLVDDRLRLVGPLLDFRLFLRQLPPNHAHIAIFEVSHLLQMVEVAFLLEVELRNWGWLELVHITLRRLGPDEGVDDVLFNERQLQVILRFLVFLSSQSFSFLLKLVHRFEFKCAPRHFIDQCVVGQHIQVFSSI